jgi:hypothetical protein
MCVFNCMMYLKSYYILCLWISSKNSCTSAAKTRALFIWLFLWFDSWAFLIRVDTSKSMVRHCFSCFRVMCRYLRDVLLSWTGHIGKFNFFELGGKNGEIRFEIDGLVAYFFSSSEFLTVDCFWSLVGVLRRMFLRPVFSDMLVSWYEGWDDIMSCSLQARRKFILHYFGGQVAKNYIGYINKCNITRYVISNKQGGGM